MHKRHGFTIVELLIVIVVIAILAAITIVGYNGVKSRADKTSLSSDLANAARQLEVAKVDNGTYPSEFPPQVKASTGNVLSLTAVSDSTTSYCINGYGTAGRVMSYQKGSGVRSYLCDGALIGTPVGGSIPGVPTDTNLVSDFSTWTLSGGVSYDSASEEIRLGTSSGTATSPLVRINGSNTCRFLVEATATQPAPNYSPDTQAYMGSRYYGADGTTQVYNMHNWQANGNAQTFAVNTSYSYSWNPGCGPNVIYVRFIIHSNPTSRTSDNRYRNPSITTN